MRIPNRKTVAKCLECYRTKTKEQRENCQNTDCPYNNADPDPEYGNFCCANNLLWDAVQFLKEGNQQRVLTLKEVKATKDDRPVFLETKMFSSSADYFLCEDYEEFQMDTSAFRNFDTISSMPEFIWFLKFGEKQDFRFGMSEYGITWRCWTAKPSDELKTNTPWEDDEN